MRSDYWSGVLPSVDRCRRLRPTPHAFLAARSCPDRGPSEYIDRILSARGEAFRQWGVQDLPSLKRKHPQVQLPRILVVIDEFQEPTKRWP